MRKIKNKTAFSVVELLLAFAVIVIVFAAVVPQFRAIKNSWAGAEAGAAIIQNGRVLAEHLSRNLSAAKYIDNVSADGDLQGYITFIDNSDAKKRYAFYDGYVVFDSGDGSGEQQLAGPVKKFQISCYDVNAVSTKDINDIRLVRFETDFPNDNALGSDKTFSSEVFIRANDQAAAVARGDTFETYGGPGFEFDTSDGTFPALAQIDSTRYLCAYIGTGNDGWVVVLTVNPSTGTITGGIPLEYDTADGRYPALSQIDSTHYLCVYYGTSGAGNAVVLTVSDTSVTAGSKCKFETRCLYPALVRIDSTRYLCAYTGTPNLGRSGYSIVLTVSGTDVKAGTPYQFDIYGTVPELIQIDSSRYLCAYQGDKNIGCAVVLTVSGTTITSGAMHQYETYGVHPALWQIDSTRYLCAYDGSNGGYARILTVSGTKITWGSRYQFDTKCSYPVLSQIDSTRYLCAYAGSGSKGRAVALTVNPNTWEVTNGTVFQYDNVSGLYPALAKIDTCNYLCAYAGQSSDGWSVILLNRVKP